MADYFTDAAKPGRHAFKTPRRTLAMMNLEGYLADPKFTNDIGSAIAADKVIGMITLPSGTKLWHGSRIKWDALSTDRTVKVGWEAYTKNDGTVVAADDDGLLGATAAATAGSAALLIDPSMLFEGDVTITITVSGGTLLVDKNLWLDLRYGRVSGTK